MFTFVVPVPLSASPASTMSTKRSVQSSQSPFHQWLWYFAAWAILHFNLWNFGLSSLIPLPIPLPPSFWLYDIGTIIDRLALIEHTILHSRVAHMETLSQYFRFYFSPFSVPFSFRFVTPVCCFTFCGSTVLVTLRPPCSKCFRRIAMP